MRFLKIRDKCLLIVIFVGIIAIAMASVSAEQTVDIGGNTFILPPNAQDVQTNADACNFTADNVSGSIIKVSKDDADTYIHSNRQRKYEIVPVTIEQCDLYRYDDRLHNERGIISLIPKGNDFYIFKLYKYSSFSSSSDDFSSGDRVKYVGILKGFLAKNKYDQGVNQYAPAI